MITAVMAVIVLFSADAFAGADMRLPVTNVPTLSEWGMVGTLVVLGLVGMFFLIRNKKHGCCS
jgi:hypothetical protein